MAGCSSKGEPKTERKDYFGCDNPNVIRACLNCKRKECNNCMDQVDRKKYNVRRKKEK